ncbi:hypothetical protein FJY84_03305 [Candidatus Bathyarchaeota archaeon]|nr:hypothetical protein [Candidatus Bathyarchaeota archaeon]
MSLSDFMPKTPEPEAKEFTELKVEDITRILSKTIKHDEVNKAITFLCYLLNYTSEDQLNLAFIAESSTGKSYIPLEVSQFFPEEDIVLVGYATPSSFFHDMGLEDKERGIKTINLHQKILIFLDQPHDVLLQRLRPLLSHDRKTILIKITDKAEGRGFSTRNIEIIGFPTTVFCSANPAMDTQEQTRQLLLSPEASEEKILEAIGLMSEKLSDREKYRLEIQQDLERRMLSERVVEVQRAHITQILIQTDDMNYLKERFLKSHPRLLPRHQRDFPRLVGLIKSLALLNFQNRQKTEWHRIIANRMDVEEGLKLYSMVSDANETGLTPEIYEMWKKVIKPNMKKQGLLKKEIHALYLKIYKKVLNSKRLDMILNAIVSSGLLREETDFNDARLKRYYDAQETHTIDVMTFKYEPDLDSKRFPIVWVHFGRKKYFIGYCGYRKLPFCLTFNMINVLIFQQLLIDKTGCEEETRCINIECPFNRTDVKKWGKKWKILETFRNLKPEFFGLSEDDLKEPKVIYLTVERKRRNK